MLVLAAACLVIGLSSCEKKESTETAKTSEAAEVPAGVTRIVFLGQKEACDCTRKRIENSWQALQTALGSRSDVEVVRLQWDVDEQAAGRYQDMKSVMVIPGLYFLDKDEKLIELLQGEVPAEKIATLLN
jgi:hypothetical protein